MTEEQKDIVYRLHNSIIKAIVDMDIEKTWDIIQKALKQQSSEDCISRAEALRHRHLIHDDDGIGYSVVRVDEIIDLPSVTPSYNLEPYSDKLWKNAYERGKADVLDKIRAEIEDLTYYCWEVSPRTVIDDVLEIIDKYKAESEKE